MTQKTAIQYLWNGGMLKGLSLSVLVLSSAIAVVYIQYLNRNLHIQLQQLQESRDRLHIEWTQLLLEQGTLGSDIRVEKIAREHLDMLLPSPNKVLVIKP
jgi:cell division protein FtsL